MLLRHSIAVTVQLNSSSNSPSSTCLSLPATSCWVLSKLYSWSLRSARPHWPAHGDPHNRVPLDQHISRKQSLWSSQSRKRKGRKTRRAFQIETTYCKDGEKRVEKSAGTEQYARTIDKSVRSGTRCDVHLLRITNRR